MCCRGGYLTKALRRGLSSALQCVFVLPWPVVAPREVGGGAGMAPSPMPKVHGAEGPKKISSNYNVVVVERLGLGPST